MRGAMIAAFVACASSSAAAQDVPWIEVSAPSECERAAAGFEARVRATLLGVPARERTAHVSIERRGARFRVSIGTRQAGEPLGTKRLLAASCQQASDAASAVLAIALSDPPPEAEATLVVSAADGGEIAPQPSSARLTARPNAATAAAAPRARTPSAPAERAAANAEPAAQRGRVALRAGVDAGTLPVATGYLGASATWLAGPIEWRAVLGIGLPYEEEEIEVGRGSWRKEQFALLDLGGCYGWGSRVWLAACAAGELGLVYSARAVNGVHDDGATTRLSGVLAAQLGYRASAIQPELELAAVASAIGAPARGPLALRASFGVGVPF